MADINHKAMLFYITPMCWSQVTQSIIIVLCTCKILIQSLVKSINDLHNMTFKPAKCHSRLNFNRCKHYFTVHILFIISFSIFYIYSDYFFFKIKETFTCYIYLNFDQFSQNPTQTWTVPGPPWVWPPRLCGGPWRGCSPRFYDSPAWCGSYHSLSVRTP